MEKIKVHDRFFRPFITNSQISKATGQTAALIDRDYAASDTPIFLIMLNGAIIYAAELLRHTHIRWEIATIRFASYSGTQSTGECRMLSELPDVSGRDVLIVEDIVDSGLTMDTAIGALKGAGAKSVRITALIFKKSTFRFPGKFTVDYPAMTFDTLPFIVGFGLDYDRLGRELPDICEECPQPCQTGPDAASE